MKNEQIVSATFCEMLMFICRSNSSEILSDWLLITCSVADEFTEAFMLSDEIVTEYWPESLELLDEMESVNWFCPLFVIFIRLSPLPLIVWSPFFQLACRSLTDDELCTLTVTVSSTLSPPITTWLCTCTWIDNVPLMCAKVDWELIAVYLDSGFDLTWFLCNYSFKFGGPISRLLVAWLG